MIVPIRPRLNGPLAERFLALAQTLARARQRNHSVELQTLLREELQWLLEQHAEQEQRAAYEASIRVLLDLVRLGWEVREQGYGIELVAEAQRRRGLTPEQVLEEKQWTKRLFGAVVDAQLGHPVVRDFARRMEDPSLRTCRKPISWLIGELYT